MPTVDGINYTDQWGWADYDADALIAQHGGSYVTPAHPCFRIAKIGNRLVGVDGAGKLFFVRGVYDTRLAYSHVLGGTTQAGRRLTTNHDLKFAGDPSPIQRWYQNVRDQLAAMHMNWLAPNSDINIPINVSAAGRQGIVRYHDAGTECNHPPFMQSAGISEAVKNLFRATKTNAPGQSSFAWTARAFFDYMDPKWEQYARFKWEVQLPVSPASWRQLSANAEADNLSQWAGSGVANEVGTEVALADGYQGVHGGMIVLWTSPTITSQPNYRDGSTTTWTVDTVNHSKATLIANLKAKYGTISALNAAWGTGGYYTSFDPDSGWGVGTGVADEDGVRPRAWFGLSSPSNYGHTQGVNNNVSDSTSWSPAVKADLDQILYECAVAFLKPGYDVIHARDPGGLYMGTNGGSWGHGTRRPVLEALRDYTDVVVTGAWNANVGIGDPRWSQWLTPRGDRYTYAHAATLMDYEHSILGEKPRINLYYPWIRNDSSIYYHGLGSTGLAPMPQAVKGQKAKVDLEAALSYKTPGGVYPVIGYWWWAMYDHPGEGGGYGLCTLNLNPYDGRNYTASMPDPYTPGFNTLTEDQPYGDVLGFAGTSSIVETDRLLGLNAGMPALIALQFSDGPPPPPPPEEFMAILNIAIENQDQEHTVDYTNLVVRFQRSTDGGVTYADVQTTVHPLGATEDSYSVPVGQSGHYRAGAALTDGAVVGPEIFSNVFQLAVFMVSTPQTITLSIG